MPHSTSFASSRLVQASALGAELSSARGNTKSLGARRSLDAARPNDEGELSPFAHVLSASSGTDGNAVTTADRRRLGGGHGRGQKDARLYTSGSAGFERDALREPGRSSEVFCAPGARQRR